MPQHFAVTRYLSLCLHRLFAIADGFTFHWKKYSNYTHRRIEFLSSVQHSNRCSISSRSSIVCSYRMLLNSIFQGEQNENNIIHSSCKENSSECFSFVYYESTRIVPCDSLCACVCVEERKREREKVRNKITKLHLFYWINFTRKRKIDSIDLIRIERWNISLVHYFRRSTNANQLENGAIQCTVETRKTSAAYKGRGKQRHRSRWQKTVTGIFFLRSLFCANFACTSVYKFFAPRLKSLGADWCIWNEERRGERAKNINMHAEVHKSWMTGWYFHCTL